MPEHSPVSRRTIVGLLGVLVTLSALDLFLSWKLIGPDGEYLFEINPIAAWWLERYGWAGMAAFKLAVTIALACIIGILVWRRPRTGELVLVFAIGAQSTVVAYSVFLVRFFEQVTADPAAGPVPIVQADGAAGPGGPRPIRARTAASPLILLLSETTVRDELNLPDELRASVDEVLRLAPPRGRGANRTPNDLVLAQEHSKRETDLLGTLSSEQTLRLQQIAWQQRGAFALSDGDVAATLELTPEQRREVRRALEDYRLARGFSPRRRPALDGDGNEAARKAEDRLWAIVTQPQRLAWKRMIGTPFDGSLSAEVARELRQSGRGPIRPH